MENFKFDPIKHIYTLDGKRLYGITNVLNVIAKPALITWAADEAVKILGWFNAKYDDGSGMGKLTKLFATVKKLTPEGYYALLTEGRNAHRKKKEKAGEAGTDVHAEIEKYIKLMISDQGGQAQAMNGYENEQVKHFVTWAVKNQIKFLASESQLFSKSMWIGGTTDMVFVKDGQKFVGDIKTASGIYPENFYQMAGYRLMLEEMGEKDFVGSAVIRLGKDNQFNEDEDVKYRFDYETDKQAFLGALAIFKANETYKV